MDIAVKQRILGGVVLLAAAILFLPVVLEGAGVKALQPPTPPAPPTTPTTKDLAPALQPQAQALAESISASHGEPTFYPVEPAVVEEPAPLPATPEQYRLEEPKAAPVAVAPVAAASGAAASGAAEKSATDKAAVDKAAADKRAAEKAAADKRAAEKLAAEKLAAEKKAAAAKAEVAKAEAAKAEAAKKAAAKVEAEKTLSAEAKVANDPDPALPQAWVVQVARLNAPEKANALVEKLRAKGYRASKAGAGDSWRVIIGPELDRSVAESIKRRLAEDPQLKLSGWIQAYRP